VLRRKGRTFADAGGASRGDRGALAGGAGDCDRPRQDPLPGFQTVFPALLRLIIRRARGALTLRSMTHAGSTSRSPRGSVKPSDCRPSHISSTVAAWTISEQFSPEVQAVAAGCQRGAGVPVRAREGSGSLPVTPRVTMLPPCSW
jgi:hypothetical protein